MFFFCIRFLALFMIAGTLILPRASAETTDCTTPMLIVADGRITQSNFSQAVTYWYGISAQAGHSYSVEFDPPADNFVNNGHVQFTSISVFGPYDSLAACRGSSSVAVTQNSGYAPVLQKNGNGAGRRVSFTAQTAGLYLLSITNLGNTGSYTFRAVDTTLFNPRWSTYSGYDEHWGLLNVSDMPISGILSVFDVNGHILAAVQLNIVAGAETFRFSFPTDLNIPRNSAGYAMFSHNGPPNSIVADAYMVNLTTGVVYTSRFDVRGMQ